MKKPNFITANTKKAFNYLRLAFIKALIFQYFELESYIRIKINISSYVIGKVLSQLNYNLNTLSNNSNKFDFD